MSNPWPGDTATVVHWVRTAMRADVADSSELTVNGIDDIAVTADLATPDLKHLTLDATRARLQFDWHAPTDPALTDADIAASERNKPEPAHEQPGVLRELRVRAAPMRIEQTDINIDVQAFDVPILWQTFASPTDPNNPESIHALTPADDLGAARGVFSASVKTQDLAPLLTSVLRPALAQNSVRLGRVKLDVTGSEHDGIRISAYAGARWKLLGASIRADALIEVTRDAVVTVRELKLGSRNPLVALALRFARKPIRETIGTPHDLSTALARDTGAESLRIHDLRVTTGKELAVSGRVN